MILKHRYPVKLRNKNILFTVEALSRVLRQGNFIYRKDIDPDRREIDSKLWIRSLDGFRVVRLFEGENIELTFQITGRGTWRNAFRDRPLVATNNAGTYQKRILWYL